MSHTVRSRSSYDLLRLHELNYRLLIRLIPVPADIRLPAVSAIGAGSRLRLHLEILEQTPYTTTISLTEYINVGNLKLAYPDLQIRLYHDAKVAEVLRYRKRTGLSWCEPGTPYKRLAVSAKEKLNRFLANWLYRCLAQGHIFNVPGLEDRRQQPATSLDVSSA